MEISIPKFDVEDTVDISKRWGKYCKTLDRVFSMKNIKDDKVKIDYLFFYGGEGLEDAYEDESSSSDQYADIVVKLTARFNPPVNVELNIYQFRKLAQFDDEPFDDFVRRLRDKAKLCDFKEADKDIKSQIIHHCLSSSLRKRGLTDRTLTLEKLIEEGRMEEVVKRQLKEMAAKRVVETESESETEAKNPTTSVNAMQRGQRDRRDQRDQRNQRFDKQKQNEMIRQRKCFRCGNAYPHDGECPANGIICSKCNRTGHFAKYCLSKTTEKSNANSLLTKKKPHKTEMPSSSDSDSECWNINSVSGKLPSIDISICGTKIKATIDTGSEHNIVDSATFQKLQITPKLEVCEAKLFPYGASNPIKLRGKFSARVRNVKGEYTNLPFLVTEGNGGNLLGYAGSSKLGLIKLVNTVKSSVPASAPIDPIKEKLKQMFPKLFEKRIGKLKDFELKLNIDKQVKPSKQKLRPIPIYLKDLVEAELKKMVEQGIIEKVNGPTPWISPIVPVRKPNRPNAIRICCDGREANKAIIRERYQAPTIDDIIPRLHGTRVMSSLDLPDAYHQFGLHKDSRYITAFNTPWGVYQYTRLNMGICAAAELFQKTLEEKLADLEGQFNVSDDLFVHGETYEQHWERLLKVLKRLEDSGLTLNEDKCQFCKEELDFFGFHFSKDGISLAEPKYRALINAETPKSVGELRSLLGLAQYCERSTPNLAATINPLRQLTKKKAAWEWTEIHDKALKDYKESILKSAMAYFNKNWKTQIFVDASQKGLGLVFAQYDPNDSTNRSIVEFKSRTLTEVESRYSQVELEALAVVWACEKLHYYLYNHPFEIVTDNKAIELIYGNPRSKQKGRIERWGLRLRPYDFTIVHKPGNDNIADYLSRNPVEQTVTSKHEEMAESYLNLVSTAATPKAISRQELIEATLKDRRLANAKKMLQGKRHLKDKRFSKIISELSVTHDGLLMRGNRLVIPKEYQKKMVKIAHGGHQGIVKTKRLARRHIWFPKMDELIEYVVRACKSCRANTNSCKINPIKMTKMPDEPWHTLALDYYGPIWGKYVLILMDFFSRYPLAKILNTTSAAAALPILNEIFAIFGIPKRLKSDNGPPFNSREFKEFCQNNNIIHDKITPIWPQANGMVERFMKNLTKAAKNAEVNGSNWQEELMEFLRAYRATPHSSTKCSPSELLFRTSSSTVNLPPVNRNSSESLLETARVNDAESKSRMKRYADKKYKTKSSVFHVGDKVLVLQTIKSKATPIFDPKPYTVVKIKGTMITVERNGARKARNSSMMKLYKEPKPAGLKLIPKPDEFDHTSEEERSENENVDEEAQDEFEDAPQHHESQGYPGRQASNQVGPNEVANSAIPDELGNNEEHMSLRRGLRNRKQTERYAAIV